jgi:hypothetical protein
LFGFLSVWTSFSQFGFYSVSQDLFGFSFGLDHLRASTIQRCNGFYASHSLFDRGGQSFDFWDFYVDKQISRYLDLP